MLWQLVAVAVAIAVAGAQEPRVKLQISWAEEASQRLVVEDQLQHPRIDQIFQQGTDPGSSL